jgi:uncharacterized protein (TIGR02145 family)
MKVCLKIFHIVVYTGIIFFFPSCEKDKTPIVTTSLISNITDSRATGGGNIIDEGSSGITASGVCWSTDSIPVIGNNATTDGANSGSFSSDIEGLAEGSIYYVRAYATNKAGVGYGDLVSFATLKHVTTVTTAPASAISTTGATLNGSFLAVSPALNLAFEYGQTAKYGNLVTLTQNSAVSAKPVQVKGYISGLITGTTYHYRFRAMSPYDTINGNDQVFTTVLSDVDGNIYHILPVGSQVWMLENLKTTRYGNGDLIGTTSSSNLDISNYYSPKYQWPCADGNAGRYYTYYTITDSRKICPDGWHVPSDDEWNSFTNYLSGNGYGYKGKETFIAKSLAATSGWTDDITPGNVGNDQASNNSSGFTGLPSGGRYSNGVINFVGLHGIWWSDSESSSISAYFRCIGYLPGLVFRGTFNKAYGLPVRCLRDK